VIIVLITGVIYVPQYIYRKNALENFNNIENVLLKNESVIGVTDSYWGDEELNDPMSYGLILSAEANKYMADKNEPSAKLMHKYGNYLLANNDLNENGITGYGLSVSHEGIPDEMIEANSEYTITNAIVIKGLIDWLDSGNPTPKEKVIDTIKKVFKPYLLGIYKNKYGFSNPALSKYDNDHGVVNASFMIAAQAKRFSKAIDDNSYSEQLSEWADSEVSSLMRYSLVNDNKNIYWPYAIGFDQKNDLVHAAYIVYAAKTYLDNGGVKINNDEYEMIFNHLNDFYKKGRWYQYPEIFGERYNSNPPIVWGIGILMYVLEGSDMYNSYEFSLFSCLNSYSSEEGLYYHTQNKENIYFRDNLFVLLGLSGVLNE